MFRCVLTLSPPPLRYGLIPSLLCSVSRALLLSAPLNMASYRLHFIVIILLSLKSRHLTVFSHILLFPMISSCKFWFLSYNLHFLMLLSLDDTETRLLRFFLSCTLPSLFINFVTFHPTLPHASKPRCYSFLGYCSYIHSLFSLFCSFISLHSIIFSLFIPSLFYLLYNPPSLQSPLLIYLISLHSTLSLFLPYSTFAFIPLLYNPLSFSFISLPSALSFHSILQSTLSLSPNFYNHFQPYSYSLSLPIPLYRASNSISVPSHIPFLT